jgi:hypothetical protein
VPKFEDITGNVAFAIGDLEEFKLRSLPELTSAAIVLINAIIQASALTCHAPIRSHIVLATDPEEAQTKEVIFKKRLTAADVLSIIRAVLNDPSTLTTVLPLDVSKLPLGHHLLERKMAAGGISFQSIDVAKDHQRSAEYILQSWFHKYGPESARKRYEQLDVIVRTECAEAFDNHVTAEKFFGPAMLSEVRQRLRDLATSGSPDTYNVRYEHLLGFASLATQECKVWWSEPFSVEES